MRKNQLQLLKNLVSVPSPSGFEGDIAQFIRKELQDYIPKSRIKIDFRNNLTIELKGKSDRTVIIDAHTDTIGFIVNNISKEGLINIQYLGYGDTTILSARHLQILGRKGKVNAVVDRKHAHLDGDEEIEAINQAQVDIGLRGYKAVSRYVSIGDPVVYRPACYVLAEDTVGNQGKFISGYGFDDKAGCYILIEVIKELVRSKKKINPTIIFSFSSREEIGCRGAKEIVNRYKPELFVGLDGTFATDYGEGMEKEVGRCTLGGGISVSRGVYPHRESVKLLKNLASRYKIKLQYAAEDGTEGTNATSIAIENGGIKVVDIGIPLRSIHSSVEVINSKDLNNVINLLKHYLLSDKLIEIMDK